MLPLVNLPGNSDATHFDPTKFNKVQLSTQKNQSVPKDSVQEFQNVP